MIVVAVMMLWQTEDLQTMQHKWLQNHAVQRRIHGQIGD